LADPDPKIRQDALGTLSSLKGDRRAYEPVLSAVHDLDAWTRRASVLHLRWFSDAAAVEHLARLVEDPDVSVRSALGETIRNLAVGTDRSAVAADALLALLADTSPQVRAGAARGLGVLRAPRPAAT
jgi:HEAT repeat protein